ncbi:MAG: hypothetical protein P1Q69_10485, partial [Candidatus Thorarchaeota archaeon]|nr:hypothetical protein [Candidatus Thorarchaeota archaeon]
MRERDFVDRFKSDLMHTIMDPFKKNTSVILQLARLARLAFDKDGNEAPPTLNGDILFSIDDDMLDEYIKDDDIPRGLTLSVLKWVLIFDMLDDVSTIMNNQCGMCKVASFMDRN